MINKFPENFNWSGGGKHSAGYVVIHKHEHPFAKSQGRIYEHRLVMEKHLGRYLMHGESVHHINGIKNDNRIENLKLFNSYSAHIKHEWKENPKFSSTIFKKGNSPPKHKESCKCFRCDRNSTILHPFKKGNPPPPHKENCKCFRCKKLFTNSI